jgi:mannose-6-phosphate isomerase-like protein (cupin superfamily)
MKMKLLMSRKAARPLRDERYGTVWETAGPATGLNSLGLAHAEVDVGKTLPAHFHERMSEVYHVLSGTGTMLLNGAPHEVCAGVTVSLPPGTVHSLINTGTKPLRFLVATSPSYDASDDHEV